MSKQFKKGLFLLPWRFMDVNEAASFLKSKHVDHVSLAIRDSQGLACYPSKVTPCSWDGGEDLLAAATAAFQGSGMSVHASISAFADMWAASQHPEWLAVRHDGVPARPQAAWSHWADGWYYALCPLRPEVQSRLFSIIEELSGYPIDGIDLDFIRFPYQPAGELYAEGWFCYCDSCRSAYKKETGEPIPAPTASPEAWSHFVNWRSRRLSAFIRDVKRIAGKGDRPKRLHMYIAVYGAKNTGPDQVELTKERYGQDLRELAGIVDAVQPMIYNQFVEEPLYYTRQNLFWIKTMTYFARQTGNKVWPTIQGCEPAPPEEIVGAMQNAINGGASGIILYPGREWHLTPEKWKAIESVFQSI